ncbi:hypothetical protein PN836_011850 [Ningiella sp. W23]|uniref:hypothetical protein n=1 Tax=Ningiella sp. W23 TaxID=3023715 RepID=UPI0037575AF7
MEMTLLIERDSYFKAEYRPTGIDYFDDNPLITSLAWIDEPKEIIKALQNLPESVNRTGSPSERSQELIHSLSSSFVPLPQHIDLLRMVHQKLRVGYASRNPIQ